jgi:hypothetical protein
MAKNQNETDAQRQRRERDENRAGTYQNQISNDENALTRKEIMEARYGKSK